MRSNIIHEDQPGTVEAEQPEAAKAESHKADATRRI